MAEHGTHTLGPLTKSLPGDCAIAGPTAACICILQARYFCPAWAKATPSLSHHLL